MCDDTNHENSDQQENQTPDSPTPHLDLGGAQQNECRDEPVKLNENGEADCVHVRKYKPSSDQWSKNKNKKDMIISVRCLACISEKEAPQGLWFCMHCLETRCGRYDRSHGVRHYEADNSHCLALSFDNWQIWCYKCDAFIETRLVKGNLESVKHRAKEAHRSKDGGRKQNMPKLETENKSQLADYKGARTKSMRVIGLQNLGNTCYFNSALQTLLYLRPFRDQLSRTMTRTEYTLVPKKHQDLPITTFTYSKKTAEPGKLTKELHNLVNETTYQSEIVDSRGKKNKNKSVTPRLVQNEIARKHRKFSNGTQQDSHELLRFLIDMVKDEEIKRLKAAFVDHFDIKDHKSQFKSYSEEKKNLLKKYASEFKNVFVFTGTFIDDTFGGKMLSQVHCLDCGSRFDVNEDFLDISLPLPADSKKGKSQRSQQQMKKPSSKQENQLNKAEKKKLKNQNSKKMDLQTFHKSTNEVNSSKSSEDIELKELKPSENKNKKGKKDDKGVDEEKDDRRKDSNSDQVTPPGDQNPDLEKEELPLSAEELNKNETADITELNGNVDNDDGTDPAHNDDEDKRSTPEGDSIQRSDDAMEVDPPDYGPHPLQRSEGEAESNSEEEVKSKVKSEGEVKSKVKSEGEVKSKGIKRLKEPGKYAEGSLEHYLLRFFSAELLEKDYLCTTCNPELASEQNKASDSNTDSDEDRDEREDSEESIDLDKLHFSDANKQFHIKTLPPVLTIHLKRFSQTGFRLNKVNRHIEFPLVLDMAPFCVANIPVPRDGADRILYGLRGVVNHSGSMMGGHYVAYVNIADWDVPSTKNGKSLAISNTGRESGEEATLADQEMEVDSDQTPVDNDIPSENNIDEQLPKPRPQLTPVIHLQKPSEEWYYISDSHYSRSDHHDVFSNQAYILFYERLPLV